MTRDPIDPAAGGKLALSGRLVTMDEHFTVIDDGVIYIDAGRVAVQPASADAPAGFDQTPAGARCDDLSGSDRTAQPTPVL